MAKKQASFGKYTIIVNDDNSIDVKKNGAFIADGNVKETLREISTLAGFNYDTGWNTRQFGAKLVDFLNSNADKSPVVAPVVDRAPVADKPKPTKSNGMPKWLWVVIAVVILLIVFLLMRQCNSEPRVIEKEVIVRDTVTVYVQQLEEIEKNFNAAEFEQGKSELSEKAKFVLHDLGKLLEKHPNLKLRIVGHTSAEGAEDFNQKLSEARAKSAVDFLVEHANIDRSRLQYFGMGSEELKNPDNPTGNENRRTEFEVIE